MKRAFLISLLLSTAGMLDAHSEELRPNGNITTPNECISHEAVIEVQASMADPNFIEMRRLLCTPVTNLYDSLFHVDYCDGAVLKATFVKSLGNNRFEKVREGWFATFEMTRYILDPSLQASCQAKSDEWEKTEWPRLMRERASRTSD